MAFGTNRMQQAYYVSGCSQTRPQLQPGQRDRRYRVRKPARGRNWIVEFQEWQPAGVVMNNGGFTEHRGGWGPIDELHGEFPTEGRAQEAVDYHMRKDREADIIGPWQQR